MLGGQLAEGEAVGTGQSRGSAPGPQGTPAGQRRGQPDPVVDAARVGADDGSTRDNLGAHTGTITYQVCETDSGDCSNEVDVTVP